MRTSALMLIPLLVACSGESSNPVHRVNERLVASTSELSDEILKAISRHVEAIHELAACEKNAGNAERQCVDFRVSLARAAARLCGLQAQRALLHKIIENRGDARGVRIDAGKECDLE